MLRNILYIILFLVAFIIIVLLAYNWNSLINYFNKPKEGEKCTYAFEPAFIEGIIENGKCVINPGNTENNNPAAPSPTSNNLKVSNPNGAHMYYGHLAQASQGMIYGKSGVILPYGTPLTMIKFTQTNLSTQPFFGYYETTYKEKYGPESGFFAAEDIIKL